LLPGVFFKCEPVKKVHQVDLYDQLISIQIKTLTGIGLNKRKYIKERCSYILEMEIRRMYRLENLWNDFGLSIHKKKRPYIGGPVFFFWNWPIDWVLNYEF